MRIKSWLCVAALAAGTAAAVAQSNVYSTNVVAYMNITVPANQYVMIANQLNTTNNALASLLPLSPDGAIFQKYYDQGFFQACDFDAIDHAWMPNGDATLNPGEGGFYQSPVATTLTFVGEILQGTLTNTLPIGECVIRSSIVPQAATPTVLGIPAEDGDTL